MIPRSINKREHSSLADDWVIENGVQQTHSTAKEKDAICDSGNESDPEYEACSTFEREQQYLIESINKLCYNNGPKILENESTTNLEYIYRAPESLNQDLTSYFIDVNEKGATPKVHICAYHINNIHKHPFLEYFLFKTNKKEEQFLFPTFEYESTMNVVTKSLTVMEVLCLTYYKNTEYKYKGFFGDNNNLYLFFDCSNLKLDSYNMGRDNDLWLVTIDEIINQESVCNFKIHKSVVDFFRLNSSFLFLTDLSGNQIEIPTVVYSGCSRKKLDFVANFGALREDGYELMGKYYYFTNYQNAIKKFGWLNDEVGCGGLVRYALFLGKMKVPLNQQGDAIDESDATKYMLMHNDENSADYKKIKMMLRVSDRDGAWTKNYDSVFLGKFDLDDGTVFNDYPLWVIKEWGQQIVLSSHIIDKTTLDKNWSKGADYFIL
jgi:hypothetical protein